MQGNKYLFPYQLWAGTEQSLDIAMAAFNHAMAQNVEAGVLVNNQDPEEEQPYNYSLQGNVGVISIRGSLVNNDSWYNRYRGLTSYADIRRALVYAANDAGAKAILLDIESGGGAVAGLAETASLVAMVDKAIKPITSYTGGVMASAAYWMGLGASKVYTSQTAIMGSIGIIATHMEYSQAYKEAGVGVTVLRAGKFKALANSHEPLTEPAKAQMQQQIEGAYGVFTGWVAERRGTTQALVDANMAQGREFFGSAAVDAGLADGVETFDSLVAKMNARILDNSPQYPNNSGNFLRGNNMKQALTEQQMAAVAAGITLTAEVPAAPAATVTPEVPAAPAAAAPQVTQVNEQQDTAVVAFLRNELAAAQVALASATVQLTELNKKNEALASTTASFAAIVGKSVSQMKVALGLSALDTSALTPEAVLAEHSATAATFVKTFPVGGVAAVSSEEKQEAASGAAPDWMQRVEATRIATRQK